MAVACFLNVRFGSERVGACDCKFAREITRNTVTLERSLSHEQADEGVGPRVRGPAPQWQRSRNQKRR